MLYRFREAQAAELGLGKRRERRPGFAGVVNTVTEAEKWRRDILSEISRKISKIQDGKKKELPLKLIKLIFFSN